MTADGTPTAGYRVGDRVRIADGLGDFERLTGTVFALDEPGRYEIGVEFDPDQCYIGQSRAYFRHGEVEHYDGGPDA